MKKTLLALSTILALSTLTGCQTTGNNIHKKYRNTLPTPAPAIALVGVFVTPDVKLESKTLVDRLNSTGSVKAMDVRKFAQVAQSTTSYFNKLESIGIDGILFVSNSMPNDDISTRLMLDKTDHANYKIITLDNEIIAYGTIDLSASSWVYATQIAMRKGVVESIVDTIKQ